MAKGKTWYRKVKNATVYVAKPNYWREEIPLDMLHYDGAYASEQYPNLFLYLDREPTYERWLSFGWRLKVLGKVRTFDPKAWFTSSHPREYKLGPVDYSKLIKIPMTEERDGYGRPIMFLYKPFHWEFEDVAKAYHEYMIKDW
jgi:hypothetical protein